MWDVITHLWSNLIQDPIKVMAWMSNYTTRETTDVNIYSSPDLLGSHITWAKSHTANGRIRYINIHDVFSHCLRHFPHDFIHYIKTWLCPYMNSTQKLLPMQGFCPVLSTHITPSIRGVLCQKQLARAWTSNYIPQYLWDVIIFPCPWYLLLIQHSLFKP